MNRFAALVVRRDGATPVCSAHGPCVTVQAAERVCALVGMTDSAAWATRPIALTPPNEDPLAPNAPYRHDAVIEVPAELADQILQHSATTDHHEGTSVVLLLGTKGPHLAVMVGPFSCAADALAWINARATPAGITAVTSQRHPMACLVLSLDGGVVSLPAIVLLDLDDHTQVAYGPFTDSAHAANYWRDITEVLTCARCGHRNRPLPRDAQHRHRRVRTPTRAFPVNHGWWR